MLPRTLKVRMGDVVTFDGEVYVVRRIFNDGTFVIRGIFPFDKDMLTFTVRYIDSEVKFKRITFLQI